MTSKPAQLPHELSEPVRGEAQKGIETVLVMFRRARATGLRHT